MNLCNDISPILFTPSIEPELKVGNHIFTHKIVTYSISINSHGRFIPFFLRLCKAKIFLKKKKKFEISSNLDRICIISFETESNSNLEVPYSKNTTYRWVCFSSKIIGWNEAWKLYNVIMTNDSGSLTIGFLRVGIADGESGRDTGFADWFGVEEETASSPFTFFELGSPIVRPEETQHRFCRWVWSVRERRLPRRLLVSSS